MADQTAQLYLSVVTLLQPVAQLQRGEGALAEEFILVLGGVSHLVVDVPALGLADAVLHGQLAALLGVQIVLVVGVHGEDDVVPVFAVFLNARHNGVGQRLGPGETQGSGDEIVLIIDDNEYAVHPSSSFKSLS